ncbi:MAG: NADH-quinone oxidoreductase subunit M [Candidatus Brocadiales bacterium]|nr:NADH-quinone oxidoreductase subunit M [Candidatus Bathyanammoxibius amoris]
MDASSWPILSLLILLPAAGAMVIFLGLWQNEFLSKLLAILLGIENLVLAIFLFMRFDPACADMQFVEKHNWIPELGASYSLGVDGISLFMVLISTFMVALAMLASWNQEGKRQGLFYGFLLFLEAGLIGLFLAQDLLLFYVFWEIMLIPMYFLIGVWGGENRRYATLKLIIYTMSTSLLMLVAILALYFFHHGQTGEYTFDITRLYDTPIPPHALLPMALAFFVAFAVKSPLFPFHTWLTDAHAEAPVSGAVDITGLLIKTGAYAFLRFLLPLFPEFSTSFAPIVVVLALIANLYGATLAAAQDDMKRLIAYASISHVGLVILGIFVFNVQGIEGALFMMVSIALCSGGLFLVVGMIHQRSGSKKISQLGGLWKDMPVLAGFFLFFVVASVGLPGLSNFVGEFLIFIGAFKVSVIYGVLAAFVVVLTAVYLLWMFWRIMLEKPPEGARSWQDLSLAETVTLTIPAVIVVVIGVYPNLLLDRIEPSALKLIGQVKKETAQLDDTGRENGVRLVKTERDGSE